jgi:hypothetical protein
MKNMGKCGYFYGLPEKGKEIYYDCPDCFLRTSPYYQKFGYQRVFTKRNGWYYFNDGCWNKLQPENPSSRYSKVSRYSNI